MKATKGLLNPTFPGIISAAKGTYKRFFCKNGRFPTIARGGLRREKNHVHGPASR